MLREIQTVFAAAVLGVDGDPPAALITRAAGIVRAGKLSAARRLEIYQHNVSSNLRGVLKDIYPVIFSVVGEGFFLHAADQYIRSHSSCSGDLHQFGGEWAGFLDTYPHAADLPYLCDVARLEWAWHEAFHGGDAPAFDLARLAAIPAEEHGTLRFTLHPTVRLIQSPFPVQRIWEVNQPMFTGEIAVDWEVPGESLLIYRDVTDGVSVLIEPISAAAYAFLQALRSHASLEAAALRALDIDGTFDLQGFLLDSVQTGVIVDFLRQEK